MVVHAGSVYCGTILSDANGVITIKCPAVTANFVMVSRDSEIFNFCGIVVRGNGDNYASINPTSTSQSWTSNEFMAATFSSNPSPYEGDSTCADSDTTSSASWGQVDFNANIIEQIYILVMGIDVSITPDSRNMRVYAG